MAPSTFALGFAAAVAALACGVDATTVAVLEFGKGGTVHRTTSTAPKTSAAGAMSFFRSLHETGKSRRTRATQYPGMSVVPNLFSRPAGGVSIGISGSVDLESMPTVAGILDEDSASVGHFNLNNAEGKRLLQQISGEKVDSETFVSAVDKKAQVAAASTGNSLESVSINIESTDAAADVDAGLARSLKAISEHAEKSGSTVVVHLVIEENDSTLERRLSESRRLEDEDKNENQDNNNNDKDDEGEDYEFDYSVYGYYKNGRYYNPYRTITEIQNFNIFLWTSVGLVVILFSANYMMMYMPLMADTLLFGESAKVAAD